MQRLLRKGVMSVLGIVVMLGFWTVRGWFEGSASAQSAAHIPARVWNGGGGQVVIEVETSEAGTLSATFETRLQVDNPNHRYLETWEKVGPGRHTYTIEVPPEVGGTVELNLQGPKVGSSVRIAVKVDDRVVGEDASTLDAPLRPGYGFFAQVHLEDYATGKLGGD